MTFAAVGSLIQGSNVSSFSLTPGGTGDLILIEIMSQTSAVTGLSSSNVTWSQVGSNFSGSSAGVTLFCNVWAGKVTAASLATVTISGGNSLHLNFVGFEYSSTVGGWALDASGTVDAATANYPTLTPTHGSGELYFGFTDNLNAASAGTTSGYVYANDSNSNGFCYNVNCANSAQTPVWADSFGKTGIAVLMFETTGAAAPLPSASQARAPGWHPGRNLPGLPGGTPFFAPPNSGVTSPGVQTIIATATAAGAASVTALVTEIPFAAAAAAGAATGNVTQPGSGGAAGAAAVSTLVTQIAPATASGAAAVTDVLTQAVTSAAAGAGSVTAKVTEIPFAAAAGAAAVTDVVTQIVIASAAGAAVVVANSGANQNGAATVTAAAAVTAFATVIAPAAATGASAVTAKAVQAVTASPAGAAAVTSKVTQAVTATSAGAAAVTAAGIAAAAIVNAVSHPAVTGQVAGNKTAGQVAGNAVSEVAAVTPAVGGQKPGSAVTQTASSTPAVSGG